jgi:hypothetical protein
MKLFYILRSIADVFLSEIKFYRKTKKGKWFYVRQPDDSGWGEKPYWTRSVSKQEEILKEENYF